MSAEAKRFYAEPSLRLISGPKDKQPLQDVEKPLLYVDSSNFNDYLFRQRPRSSPAVFAKHLTLKDFERSVRAVAEYVAPHKGDIFPLSSPTDNEEQLPEVSRSFYYDPSLQAIRSAPIVVGNKEEVSHDMQVHINRGKEPVFLVHRHEEDHLGSEDDPVPHIESPYSSNEPWVKASMIILPNVQILQIVTTDTVPVMTKEGVNKFLSSWDGEFLKAYMRDAAELKRLWDANPQDELAERRYRNAISAADNGVRVQLMRETGLLYYLGKNFKDFTKLNIAA